MDEVRHAKRNVLINFSKLRLWYYDISIKVLEVLPRFGFSLEAVFDLEFEQQNLEIRVMLL